MGKPTEPQVSVTDTADIKVWFASQFVLTGFFIGQWQGWTGYGSKLQSGSLNYRAVLDGRVKRDNPVRNSFVARSFWTQCSLLAVFYHILSGLTRLVSS
jgi:hypothetical protein